MKMASLVSCIAIPEEFGVWIVGFAGKYYFYAIYSIEA
jgi:hypothetical protein